MKLSFTTMATPKLDGAEAIKTAAKYGYNGVDLRVSDVMGELSLNSTLQEINELKNIFSMEGIEPSGLLCYNEAGTDEPSSWKGMTESILKNIEIAYALGSPTIRIFGGNPYQYKNHGDHISRTADSIAEALRKSSNNITVLMQNHQGGYSAADVINLAAIVNDRRFGLAFSPDHCVIMGENLRELYDSVKPVTSQIYFSDLYRKGDQFDCAMPGKGCVPLEETYTAMCAGGFDGWLTFKWEKIWRPELEEPEAALPYFIDYIDKLIEYSTEE